MRHGRDFGVKREKGAVRRRWLPGVLLGLTLVTALGAGACSSGNASGSPEPEEPAAAKVVAQPGNGARQVSPVEPIKLSVPNGTIKQVELTNPEGKLVEGKQAKDNRSWQVTEPLGYGKTYTWSGTAVSDDGKRSAIKGSFTTVEPAQHVSAQLNTGDGQTYGIAMPIKVTFDAPVADKAAVEKAMTVRTSNNTEGAWAWLDDQSAHWRPKEYWQPGTKVTVDAKIYGVHFGEGAYGASDVSSHFTIGRAQIVKGNTQTHRVVVLRDGNEIANYPASYGLETDPGRVTKSGTHVVMSKHSSYAMTNEEYGYRDFVVPWAVRISNNGEFIHGLADSVWAQGSQNVSHGCVNLSPTNAQAYFNDVLVGDPVEIEGSDQRLSAADGDYYDWTLSWDEWLSKAGARS
ncbi:MAG: L,D-transpeptidase family protein [Pseudonocardiaceae bacterium]|nr:L,D-transpeptidase family protein [Pseudonocardiaceae bacterium]